MKEALVSMLLDPGNAAHQSRWFAPGSAPSASFPVQELFDALQNFPIGVAICDRRLCFEAVNRKLAEINNVPLEEHPGRPVQEFVGNLASTVNSRLEQVFSTGRPLYNAQLIGQLGANPVPGQWLENYFPILDDFGRVAKVGVFLVSLQGVRPHSGPNRTFPGSAIPTDWQSSIPLSIAKQASILKEHSASTEDQCHHQILTARETNVLRLLASGASSKEVSAILAISVKTVDTYRSRLMLKLHATSFAHLVHYAIRNQFINLQA